MAQRVARSSEGLKGAAGHNGLVRMSPPPVAKPPPAGPSVLSAQPKYQSEVVSSKFVNCISVLYTFNKLHIQN